MLKRNTFVIPVIRPDLIERCLETLYAHTPHNFYVCIVDQTYDGLPQELIDKYVHLYLRPRRNLGFAKATNMGIKLVETPYFTMCNDDVEFIDSRWWGDVLKTFDKVDRATPDRPCMMVNPGSTKLPDWSVGLPSGQNHYIIPYKPDYTPEEYDWLVNEDHYVNQHLTLAPGSVIDGVTMYCSVFKTDKFLEVGMLNERFYPGGGEDYDYNCRANMAGYRCVGTTMSWVYHHWSSTLSELDSDKISRLVNDQLRWNNNHKIWGANFDIWGTKDLKTVPPIVKRPL